MKCGDCRFWRRATEDFAGGAIETLHGECRRYAPRPGSDQLARALNRLDATGHTDPRLDALWPLTNEDDFCGEFTPKNQRVGFV